MLEHETYFLNLVKGAQYLAPQGVAANSSQFIIWK
jgi:hypothetical protein